MNRYEQIFEATGRTRLPVRLRRFNITKPFSAFEVFHFQFTAPCPCKGWAHDIKTKFGVVTTRPDDVTMREQFRFMKRRLREEAANHAREFIACGTIDGVRA